MLSNPSKKQMRSVEASRAVWQTSVKLTRSELLVLQAMASHADADFSCHPSLDRLARMVRLSRRQVIRILHSLRERGHVAFEENRGGRKKCNRYRLLIVGNRDKKSAIDADIGNGDKQTNSDILNRETVTSSAKTVTGSDENSDSAVSPEGFKGLNSLKEGERKPKNQARICSSTAPRENFDTVWAEVDRWGIEAFIGKMTREGTRITCTSECSIHGPFSRSGFHLDDWILWSGVGERYGPGWSSGAGCVGCDRENTEALAEAQKDRPNFVNSIRNLFELEVPVTCTIHEEEFISRAHVTEYTPEWIASVGRERFYYAPEDCELCQAEMMEEMQLQNSLERGVGLSVEEWKRGGEAFLATLQYARGWIDCPTYLRAVQAGLSRSD